MPTVTAHAAGTFCWPELSTNDQVGVKRFYSDLFGWGVRDVPMESGGTYTIFTLRGADVAACYGKIHDMYEEELPPHWISYVLVPSADVAAATVRSAGGTVLKEPWDVPGAGRMAVMRDPTGATFCVWEDKGKSGVGVIREPGALYWTELLTTDTERAAQFYETLFGWKRQLWPSPEEPSYHLFANGDAMAAGMTPITPEVATDRSLWTLYFHVTDCDRTIVRARDLGGRLTMVPQTVPGVGTFAFIADPAGAHFGLLQPA
jgi:predicted enzyme related to lactoylglutathione lyase